MYAADVRFRTLCTAFGNMSWVPFHVHMPTEVGSALFVLL